jgi:hypothetical protein
VAEIIERETTTAAPSTPVVVTERGGGGGSALAVVLGLLIIGAIIFFAFLGGGRWLSGVTGGGNTNVRVEQPGQAPNQNPPSINIEKPNVTINYGQPKQQQPANGTATTGG